MGWHLDQESRVCIPTVPLFYWVASNLWQVVDLHCLPNLLSSKKLRYNYEREFLN